MKKDNEKMTTSRLANRSPFTKAVIIVCIILATSSIGLLGIFATGRFDWTIQQFIADRRADTHFQELEEQDMSGYFSEDYTSARKRIVEAGQSAGAVMSNIVLDKRGPVDEVLTVDIAWFGSSTPKRVLLHTSGLHGVEGFAGSAIQLKILKSRPVPPNGDAIVFVHALSPYGMAWLRRFNESNVDLNRNFRFNTYDWSIDATVYAQLDDFLNPAEHRFWDSFLLQAYIMKRRFGMDMLRRTIPVGQSFNPKGLFYIGNRLEEGPQLYLRWLSESLSSTERLIVVDVHTGLGELGQESLFHKIAATDSSVLSRQLNRKLLTNYGTEGVAAYSFYGAHSEAFNQFKDHCMVDFITQEFGTYPNLYVMQALRDENRSHHLGGNPTDDLTKHRLKETFCPAHPRWQAQVISDGVSLFNRSKEWVFEQQIN